LFVAAWLPASLISQVRALDRPARAGLRWTTEDQWHVTLCFLGEVEHGMSELSVRLASVASRSDVVGARIGPRAYVLGDRVWVLPVRGVEQLASAVEGATSAISPVEAGRRRFRGHLTLARGRDPESLVGLPAHEVVGGWMVDEMTLVRSDLQPEGARYEVIGRWSLGNTPVSRS
jgi:2'-5' RNA ligase